MGPYYGPCSCLVCFLLALFTGCCCCCVFHCLCDGFEDEAAVKAKKKALEKKKKKEEAPAPMQMAIPISITPGSPYVVIEEAVTRQEMGTSSPKVATLAVGETVTVHQAFDVGGNQRVQITSPSHPQPVWTSLVCVQACTATDAAIDKQLIRFGSQDGEGKGEASTCRRF